MANRRSINNELIACLEQVLLPAKISAQDIKANAQKLRRQLNAEHFNAALSTTILTSQNEPRKSHDRLQIRTE
jgi:hypothetical protein